MATAQRPAAVNWVKSYPHTRCGFHSSQSGNGRRGAGSRADAPVAVALHGLLDWERAAIVELFDAWQACRPSTQQRQRSQHVQRVQQ